MFRVFAFAALTVIASLAHANDFEDADKAWSQGKPWPAHWGRLIRPNPYREGWNLILMGFVNKVYEKDQAANTWLKNISAAMQKDASVEICTVKRGLLELSGLCGVALVDPEIVGTLKEGDVVAFFYSNHGTGLFSSKPGSEGRTTLRVFQKVADREDSSCWAREALVFKRPISEECLNRVDVDRAERILTRDFGPRSGAEAMVPENAPGSSLRPVDDKAAAVEAKLEETKP